MWKDWVHTRSSPWNVIGRLEKGMHLSPGYTGRDQGKSEWKIRKKGTGYQPSALILAAMSDLS